MEEGKVVATASGGVIARNRRVREVYLGPDAARLAAPA
jgi:ABC-type branched-subunit amino acid transport system ATPase component